MCNPIEEENMHPKVNTHTPPPVRYRNSHRTAYVPGGKTVDVRDF